MPEYTTRNGLLYKDGCVLGVHQADKAAREFGFMYAEQLVKSLESAALLQEVKEKK